ncbi:MAG: IS21 family transposase [Acidimicrobiia bacterium]
MLTEEEYMDVLALRRQGLTIGEIATETGYHPATISKWLAAGGPPARRQSEAPPIIDERWAARIAELLRRSPKLLATSVFDILRAEGFEGSYPTVSRHLNGIRGPRFRAAPAASVPIETAPGEECQFDFSDVAAWTVGWGLGEVSCFQAILCWSRWRLWWFTTSEDREHTFEGLVRFFEAAGGVTRVARTDRLGALGVSQGRRFRLHPPTVAFAKAHGCEVRACQPGDAARKGKVERPFRDAKERFLEELVALGPPSTLAELNQRAERWLAERVHARPHRTTGVPPHERLLAERRLLQPLPRRRFDTAYTEARRVHVAVPMIEWRGVRYSVPVRCLGQRVEVRQEVDGDRLELRWAGELVRSHRLAVGEVREVWDGDDFAQAQAAALGRHRRHLHVVVPEEPAPPTQERLELGNGDYDVEPLDLNRYDVDGGGR